MSPARLRRVFVREPARLRRAVGLAISLAGLLPSRARLRFTKRGQDNVISSYCQHIADAGVHAFKIQPTPRGAAAPRSAPPRIGCGP